MQQNKQSQDNTDALDWIRNWNGQRETKRNFVIHSRSVY